MNINVTVHTIHIICVLFVGVGLLLLLKFAQFLKRTPQPWTPILVRMRVHASAVFVQLGIFF